MVRHSPGVAVDSDFGLRTSFGLRISAPLPPTRRTLKRSCSRTRQRGITPPPARLTRPRSPPHHKPVAPGLLRGCERVVPLYIPYTSPLLTVPPRSCPAPYSLRPASSALTAPRVVRGLDASDYQTPTEPNRLRITHHASIFQRQVLRPQPRFELPEAKPAGLVFAHVIHVGLGWDFLLEPDGPVGGID